MKEGSREKFKTCQHDWELHVDVESCGGPAAGNSIFKCKNCDIFVTMTEKCALDQTEAQIKSLTIQEKLIRIGMWANIIAAVTVIIAFLALIFSNKWLS